MLSYCLGTVNDCHFIEPTGGGEETAAHSPADGGSGPVGGKVSTLYLPYLPPENAYLWPL